VQLGSGMRWIGESRSERYESKRWREADGEKQMERGTGSLFHPPSHPLSLSFIATHMKRLPHRPLPLPLSTSNTALLPILTPSRLENSSAALSSDHRERSVIPGKAGSGGAGTPLPMFMFIFPIVAEPEPAALLLPCPCPPKSTSTSAVLPCKPGRGASVGRGTSVSISIMEVSGCVVPRLAVLDPAGAPAG
jgi:hypothetical protein